METLSALLTLCSENSLLTGEFPAQRPVARSFDVSLIYAWINGWVHNHEAGDLSHHRAHYGVTAMATYLLYSCMPGFHSLFAGKVKDCRLLNSSGFQDSRASVHCCNQSNSKSPFWFNAFLIPMLRLNIKDYVHGLWFVTFCGGFGICPLYSYVYGLEFVMLCGSFGIGPSYSYIYIHGLGVVMLCGVFGIGPWYPFVHGLGLGYTHILEVCFSVTVKIRRLVQCQWSNLSWYGLSEYMKKLQIGNMIIRTQTDILCMFMGYYVFLRSKAV